MMDVEKIKNLREETGISIAECKKALEEAGGDIESAKEILKKIYSDLILKRAKKETTEGVIASYVHPNKKIGVLLELRCETDFVARSNDFQNLAHELCLQIAAMGDEIPVLSQPWIRDESKTIGDLINEYITKLDENISLKRYIKYEL